MRSEATASCHVAVEVDVLADGLQHEGLLAVAEFLMAGLARHRHVLVRPDELAVGAGLRPCADE